MPSRTPDRTRRCPLGVISWPGRRTRACTRVVDEERLPARHDPRLVGLLTMFWPSMKSFAEPPVTPTRNLPPGFGPDGRRRRPARRALLTRLAAGADHAALRAARLGRCSRARPGCSAAEWRRGAVVSLTALAPPRRGPGIGPVRPRCGCRSSGTIREGRSPRLRGRGASLRPRPPTTRSRRPAGRPGASVRDRAVARLRAVPSRTRSSSAATARTPSGCRRRASARPSRRTGWCGARTPSSLTSRPSPARPRRSP